MKKQVTLSNVLFSILSAKVKHDRQFRINSTSGYIDCYYKDLNTKIVVRNCNRHNGLFWRKKAYKVLTKEAINYYANHLNLLFLVIRSH